MCSSKSKRMSVVWPSGATDATFFVARHPIKNISNSIIDFDTKNIETVLPIKLKREAKRVTERINSHYLKSRQIEKRSFGEKHDDDFQQYNWGLSLTLEMGLFSDQAELLMVLYARDIEGRITEKEYILIISQHTSFRHLPKFKKKTIMKDLLSSWKINMKKAKFLPPTISKKAFLKILDVNFLDFDINMDQISHDFMKFDQEAQYLQSLLLDDPILRGEFPPPRKNLPAECIIQTEIVDEKFPGFTVPEKGTSQQDRERMLRLQKSFSEYDEGEKERLQESESARREAFEASNDELATRVKEIKRERQIKRLQDLEKAQLDTTAELLESTRNISVIERSLTTLHIPISLPTTARKYNSTPRSALNTSRPPIERTVSSSPPPQTRKHLPKTMSLPLEIRQNSELDSFCPSPGASHATFSPVPVEVSSLKSPYSSNSVDLAAQSSVTYPSEIHYPAISCHVLCQSSHHPTSNGDPVLNLSETFLVEGINVDHSQLSLPTSPRQDLDLDQDSLQLHEFPISDELITNNDPEFLMDPKFVEVPSESCQICDQYPSSQPQELSHEVIDVGDSKLNVSAYSITELASQPSCFPNLTDLFELPYLDMLFNVPKTGTVLRILIRHDDEGDVSGLFVHGFIPYCRAEEQGLIKVGDEIISVNQINVQGKQLDDVVHALKDHHEEYVPLIIRRRDPHPLVAPPSPWKSPRLPHPMDEISPRPFTTEDGSQPDDFPDFSDLFTLPSQTMAVIVPKTNGQLRVMIRHDDDGSHKGLFIHGFRPYSNAEAQGLLQVGDEILEIDGVTLAGGQIEELIDVLKVNHLSTVKMLICRRQDMFTEKSTGEGFSPCISSATFRTFLNETNEPSHSYQPTQRPTDTFITSSQDQLVQVPRTEGFLRIIIKSSGSHFFIHGFKGKCRAEEVLRPGDVVLEVNGHSISGSSLKEVSALITNCSLAQVPMLIRRSYSVRNLSQP
jgi:C-terminal processing protease CtpA/Prc